MSNMSKELLREYIKEQNFTTPNEILSILKDMFRDVLQELLEAEINEVLSYGKYDSISKSIDNSRNGYSKKTLKTELGPVEINIPRDREKVNLNLELFLNIKDQLMEYMKKYYVYMQLEWQLIIFLNK